MLNPTIPVINTPKQNANKPNNTKYKTILCKHFNTPQGCSYGEKCQFAHGNNELRINSTQYAPMIKNQNNLLNYKIAKCKNWEKDGNCKYGSLCTFAHGDTELRTKNDNLSQIGPFPIMLPYNMNSMGMMMPPNINFNQMPQMIPDNIDQNQLMMGMMMAPNENIQKNNENSPGNGENNF